MAAVPASVTLAKRTAPARVTPVRSGKIEYRAGRFDNMGCVEAWDTQKNERIWWRQIYVVEYDRDLETDVQDVFITKLLLQENQLTVTNERGSEYQLDLATLNVKVIKGRLVEGRGNRKLKI